MKKLGFGLMRLPLTDKSKQLIDVQKVGEMVDYFMKMGYNYFDTAHVYHKGNSEEIVKQVLTDKYPRESFILTTKLPIFNLESKEDCERIFNKQLAKCGVDYFDFYLLHNISTKHINKVRKFDCFDFVRRMKDEGKIRHVGISCHDTPDFLEEVLVNHPEIEVVQLQINYLDWNDKVIKARECYEVACKYNKKVIIMEGLKGGTLVNLSDNATNIIKDFDEDVSPLALAFRFNYSLDNIFVVLSGMGNIEEIHEDIMICENFEKLTSEEYILIEKVVHEIGDNEEINCTGCNYCISHCPTHINIPRLFELYNSQQLLEKGHSLSMYYNNITSEGISASSCLKCRSCTDYCPQSIDIPSMLELVTETFE